MSCNAYGNARACSRGAPSPACGGCPGGRGWGGLTMAGCLGGIRVLELGRYRAGRRGGMILSDLGGEVIKLEKPGGEETRKSAPMVRGQSVYFSVYNRGKKSIC